MKKIILIAAMFLAGCATTQPRPPVDQTAHNNSVLAYKACAYKWTDKYAPASEDTFAVANAAVSKCEGELYEVRRAGEMQGDVMFQSGSHEWLDWRQFIEQTTNQMRIELIRLSMSRQMENRLKK